MVVIPKTVLALRVSHLFSSASCTSLPGTPPEQMLPSAELPSMPPSAPDAAKYFLDCQVPEHGASKGRQRASSVPAHSASRVPAGCQQVAAGCQRKARCTNQYIYILYLCKSLACPASKQAQQVPLPSSQPSQPSCLAQPAIPTKPAGNKNRDRQQGSI